MAAKKIAYHGVVIDTSGTGTQATITVYGAGTLVASTIYSSPAGAAQANPFMTDAHGRFVFYADQGEYDINVTGGGIVAYTLSNVSIIGDSTRIVVSDPGSGEHRVKKFRREAGGNIVVTYDGVAEP